MTDSATSGFDSASPFSADLGVQFLECEADKASLRLPFDERHSIGGVLHGGAIASLVSIAAQQVLGGQNAPTTAQAKPSADGPTAVSSCISYLRAVRGGTIVVTSRLLRRSRELAFLETQMLDEAGTCVAHATSTYGDGRTDDVERWSEPPLKDTVAPIQAAVERVPFLSRRQVRAVGVDAGKVELCAPLVANNRDHRGHVHEGIVLGLIDAAGATCPWTAVDVKNVRGGATVSLHAQLVAPLPAEELLARAVIRARSGQLFWCDVVVAGVHSRRVIAIGSVAYRFNS